MIANSTATQDFRKVQQAYGEAVELINEIWVDLRREAKAVSEKETWFDSQLVDLIFERPSLGAAQARLIASVVSEGREERDFFESLIEGILSDNHKLVHVACLDLLATQVRGASSAGMLESFLFSRPYHALQCHRVCNWLWHGDRSELALHLQSMTARRSGISIHPSVSMGHGIYLEDPGGILLGEGVSFGNNAKLGASVLVCRSAAGPQAGAPSVSDGVTIDAGSQVVGPVHLGVGSSVRPGSVVLQDVEPFAIVRGNPASVIGQNEPHPPSGSLLA